MTVKKLSDSDKQEILKLYRQTPETTSTLADRYGVSNSTISRLLKATLPEDEYETLISAKRAARTPHSEATQMQLLSEPEPEIAVTQPAVEAQSSPETSETNASTPVTRKRRRTSATSEPEIETPTAAEVQPEILEVSSAVSKPEIKTPTAAEVQPEILEVSSAVSKPEIKTPTAAEVQPEISEVPSAVANISPVLLNQGVDSQPQVETPSVVVTQPLDEDSEAEANAIAAEMLGEELLDDSEDLDDEEDLEDYDEEEEEDLEEEMPIVKRRLPVKTLIQVLPLSQATLPKTCYLVIDKAAELITRPLKDFGDLGQIPTQEVQEKTLPIFDNHRVARRFSNKRERVIKVPDSRMLQKTRSHLQAKGITRLLVDGQVYSLSST